MKLGAPNFGMALAALLMSVSFWVYVQGQEARKTTEILSVPLVAILNDPSSDYPYVAVKPPSTVKVRLEGTPEELAQFNNLYNLRKVELQQVFKQEPRTGQTELKATVDLTHLTLDQTTVRPQPFRNKDLGNIRADYLDEIPITVEEKDSRPVKVEITVQNTPVGYEYSSANVDPPMVMISGARSAVKSVARISGVLSLKTYTPGQSYAVLIRPSKEDGSTVSDVTLADSIVSVTPLLASAPAQASLFVDFRYSGPPPLGFKVKGASSDPTTIDATGPRAQSQGRIFTEPIRITNLKEGANVIRRVKLVKPKGVDTIARDTCTVTITLEKLPPLENPNPNPPTTNPTSGTTGTPPNQ